MKLKLQQQIFDIKKSPLKASFSFVRMTGIEPAHLAALDPKSSVSTSSTTSALLIVPLRDGKYTNFSHITNSFR